MIHQICPRSFADGDGDGTGDLTGITARMGHLAGMGVDALWLSPCFASPQIDHSCDISDYGDRSPLRVAGRHGRVDHNRPQRRDQGDAGLRAQPHLRPAAWFQAALATGRGSTERERYLFRDGHGLGGDEPPNDWRSVFGGPSRTRVPEPDGSPGQWY